MKSAVKLSIIMSGFIGLCLTSPSQATNDFEAVKAINNALESQFDSKLDNLKYSIVKAGGILSFFSAVQKEIIWAAANAQAMANGNKAAQPQSLDEAFTYIGYIAGYVGKILADLETRIEALEKQPSQSKPHAQ